MKKVTLVFIAISCIMIFPNIGKTLGFEGIGGKFGIVFPDNADTTFGLGVIGDLGTVTSQLPSLKGEVGLDYWGNSSSNQVSDWSFSVITIGATVKYHFSIGGNISPFAGGGLGLAMGRSSYDWKIKTEYMGAVEDSNTEIDPEFHIVGGIDMPVGQSLKFVGEAKYSITDADSFQISGALVFKLK